MASGDTHGLTEMLARRAEIVRRVRGFFDGRGFVEVETPARIAAPARHPAAAITSWQSPEAYSLVARTPEPGSMS